MMPNYPGGFAATSIVVFLYADGRQNFIMGDFEGGRRQYDETDRKSFETAQKHVEIDVAGLDWSGIIKAADRAADEMRGCTWKEFQRRKHAASGYTVQKGKITGHSGPARWHVLKDGKAISAYGFKTKWQAEQRLDEIEAEEQLTAARKAELAALAQREKAEALAKRAARAIAATRRIADAARQMELAL